MVARVLAMDDEAAGAGRDRGKVDLGRKAAGVAEDHVAVARIAVSVAGAVAAECPDDEVVEAVAVDVAGRGDRKADSSPASWPWIMKPPLPPAIVARSISAAKPEALPKTT